MRHERYYEGCGNQTVILFYYCIFFFHSIKVDGIQNCLVANFLHNMFFMLQKKKKKHLRKKGTKAITEQSRLYLLGINMHFFVPLWYQYGPFRYQGVSFERILPHGQIKCLFSECMNMEQNEGK